MRFDDDAYILAYQNNGMFPAIHRHIAQVIKHYASEAEPCMDLGACTSLLSAQAVEIGRSLCVSVEGNLSSINKGITHPKVIKKHLAIDYDTLPEMEALLQTYRPSLVIARRVLSEFTADGTSNLVKALGALFWQYGVEKIVLEGRIVVSNACNILPSANHEALALREHYQTIGAYKNVRFLTRKV